IALTGALCLGVLVGIGRFAFTPVLPAMLAEGGIDLSAAGTLASLNYLGYLLGALACSLPLRLRRGGGGRQVGSTGSELVVMTGLLATAALTAAMALPWPALWPFLRLAAGVASAFAFVHATGWCLNQLALRGRTAIGGLMYTGPGVGIAGSGLLAGALLGAGASAAAAWTVFGVLALALALLARPTLRATHLPRPTQPEPGTPTPPSTGAPAVAAGPAAPCVPVHPAQDRLQVWGLTLAYGLAGFGYIIPATFLPVIGQAWLGQAPVVDLFWPLFGLGVVLGALVATRVRDGADLAVALCVCHAVQAAGIALALWSPTALGFGGGSLMLGLPFSTITFFVMREVRRLRPQTATRWIGLTTAVYGVGQIAGPPLAAWRVALAGDPRTGFELSMQWALAALLVGGAIHLALRRRKPALSTVAR
ncbi:MAG: YbfB/YjiJ family MFS transporter, partial [Rubrivivax sp.]